MLEDKMSDTKKRIHVVINPAAGKDEPILNAINDVFRQHGIEWTVSMTHKYGDATKFARQAAEEGFDIVGILCRCFHVQNAIFFGIFVRLRKIHFTACF